MKKAIKLLWMVLFALPLISLVSCGDDEPEPSVEIGDISYTVSEDNSAATFTVPVKISGLSDGESVAVSYNLGSEPAVNVKPTSNGSYTFTISGLTPGYEYGLTVTATAGSASDSKTLKFSIPLFTDYSVLIGKTRQQTINYMGEQPYDSDELMQTFVVNAGNVDYLQTWYSYFDDVVLDNVVVVDCFIDEDLPLNAVTNYLMKLYTFDGIDEDGWYTYTGDNMVVWFVEYDEEGELANEVIYYNNPSDSDKKEVRGADMRAVKAAIKARKATRASF